MEGLHKVRRLNKKTLIGTVVSGMLMKTFFDLWNLQFYIFPNKKNDGGDVRKCQYF